MLEYILFAIGIILLIKGADYLVDGASSLAKKMGISALVIGLTIVAFGTSMPELVVNVLAAINGSSDVAFGNIVGSNIANILLILGITAIICNVKVQRSTTWKEIPLSLLGVIILILLASTLILDGLELTSIYRFEGLILLCFFVIFLYYVFSMAFRDKEIQGDIKSDIKLMSNYKIALYILGGLVALYFGGKWTVEGAVSIARLFGMSEYFISLTIVAVGTSLPELITSVVAAMKKEGDIAIGNIVGSNIFNIFWILGFSAVITPIVIPATAMLDLVVLLFATILLFLFMFLGKKHELERWQGIVFLICYVAYIIFLIYRG